MQFQILYHVNDFDRIMQHNYFCNAPLIFSWTDQQRAQAAKEGWGYRLIYSARLVIYSLQYSSKMSSSLVTG